MSITTRPSHRGRSLARYSRVGYRIRGTAPIAFMALVTLATSVAPSTDAVSRAIYLTLTVILTVGAVHLSRIATIKVYEHGVWLSGWVRPKFIYWTDVTEVVEVNKVNIWGKVKVVGLTLRNGATVSADGFYDQTSSRTHRVDDAVQALRQWRASESMR